MEKLKHVKEGGKKNPLSVPSLNRDCGMPVFSSSTSVVYLLKNATETLKTNDMLILLFSHRP